jgi:phage-related protein
LRYATTESQLQLLKNTVKDFLITLGDRFLPIIQEAVTAIRPFIEKIASAPEPVVKLTLAILGIAAAIGPALTIVGALATALGFLLSPIGLVVAAVAGLALAFATNFGGIRDKVQPVLDWLVGIWDNIVEAIERPVSRIKGAIENIARAFQRGGLDGAIEAIKRFGPTIKTSIEDVLAGIGKVIGPILADIGQQLWQAADAWGYSIIQALNSFLGVDLLAVFDGVVTAVTTAFQNVQTAVQPVIDWLSGAWSAISEAMAPFLDILAGMANKIESAFNKGGVAGAIEAFKALWPDIVTVVGEALGKLGQVVGPLLAQVGQALLSAAAGWGTAIVTALGDALGVDIFAVFEGLKAKVTDTFGQISTTVKTVWTPIQAIFQSIGAVLGPTLSTAFENLKTAFAGLQPLGESLKGLLEALAPVIGVVVVGAIGLLVGAFNGIVTAVGYAAPYIIQAVTGAVDIIAGVIGGLVDIIRWVVGAVTGDSEAMAAAWESLKSRAVTIWEGIKNLVVGAVTGFVNLVLGLVVGFVEGVIGFFTGLYERLVGGSIVPDLVNGIISWFQSLLAPVAAVWNGILSTVAAVWATISGVVSAGVALVRSVVEAGWAAIAGAVEAAIGRVTAIVGTLASMVVPVAIAAWDAIKSAASTAWEAVQDIVSRAVDAVSNFIDDGVRGWESAWSSFKSTAEGLWKGLAATISTAWNGLVSTANSTWNRIKSVITAAIQAVITKVHAILSPLTSMRGLFDNIQGAADGLKEGLNRLKKAIDGIKKAIEAALSKLKNFLSSLANAIIPDWLQGHSPSPLENWIRGISEAFGESSAATRDWGESMKDAGQTARDMVATMAEGMAVPVSLPSQVGGYDAFSGFSDAVQAMVTALNAVRNYVAGSLQLAAFQADMEGLIDTMKRSFRALAYMHAAGDLPGLDTLFGSVLTAVEAVSALRDYVAVGKEQVKLFVKDLAGIISVLLDATYEIRQSATTILAFMPVVTAIVVPIQESLKALAGLRDYSEVGLESVEAFAKDLADVVALMEKISARFEEEGLAAAIQFSASAGVIASAAGQAAEGLKKMADYGGISLEAMERFRADLPVVVAMMEAITSRFALEGVQAAEEFSASAGAISRAAGDAAQGLARLADYGGVPLEAMEQFRADLPMVVAMMEAISAEFAIEGVQAAEEFGASAGAIAQAVGRGVGGLQDLGEYGGIADGAAELFRTDMAAVTRTMVAAVADLAGLDLPETVVTMGQVAAIADSVQKALRALEGLSEYEGGIGSGLQAFVSDVELLIAAFEDLRDAIPEWLIPGSPTPLETGIKGITGALSGLQGAMVDTSGLFALPAPRELFGDVPAVASAEATQPVEEHKHYHLDYHGYTRDDPGERDAARVLGELEILTG